MKAQVPQQVQVTLNNAVAGGLQGYSGHCDSGTAIAGEDFDEKQAELSTFAGNANEIRDSYGADNR